MSESRGNDESPRRPSRKVIVRRRQFLVGGGVVALGAAAVGIGAAVGSSGSEPAASSPPGTPDAGATPEQTATARPVPEETTTPEPVETPSFDLAAESVDVPSSPWVVCNKTRPLDPVDYEADDLVFPDVSYVNRQPMRQATADALVALIGAASSEAGLTIRVQSAYRSYSTQVSVYNGWVASRGQAGADATSARPGFSEHQTGWAVDVTGASGAYALEPEWGTTPEGIWVAANANRFGFIVRYQEGGTPVTGYEYEPYHLRYVGSELSLHMQEIGVTTLEELFGLPAAPDYL